MAAYQLPFDHVVKAEKRVLDALARSAVGFALTVSIYVLVSLFSGICTTCGRGATSMMPSIVVSVLDEQGIATFTEPRAIASDVQIVVVSLFGIAPAARRLGDVEAIGIAADMALEIGF